MALQRINWLQIDTATVPSGSIIDIGAIDGPLHAGYFENLYVSGQTISDFIAGAGTTELNIWSASVKEAIETTGSNLTVKGNLTVLGTTTSVSSNVVTIGDNILSLNGTGNAFGGIQVNDPTNPSKISGSLLWDSNNDRWIAGPLGSEDTIILQQDLTDYSSSVSNLINDTGIWRQTGSFYATTHDLQMTGSVIIKGDLRVEGMTTLVQTLDPNVESLVVSGAMSIVRNQIGSQIKSASLTIQNLGSFADRNNNSVIDCGSGF
jgi:hypothetical protein